MICNYLKTAALFVSLFALSACGAIVSNNETSQDSLNQEQTSESDGENPTSEGEGQSGELSTEDALAGASASDIQTFVGSVKSGTAEPQDQEMDCQALGLQSAQVKLAKVAAYCEVDGGYAVYLIGKDATTGRSVYEEEILVFLTPNHELVDYKIMRCGYQSASIDSKRVSVKDLAYDTEGKRFIFAIREGETSYKENYDRGELNSYQIQLPLSASTKLEKVNSTPYDEKLILK
ncbi:MAG: hypothetical protein EAZ57_01405 [Cytophagales bacterium]|nr:MAG: hypothetical protein EAZ67_01870 [Cytophagales bacterium]TAF62107.1 MAG: hypothetical protein EAZ57_01405 [Cytophagales bacterium]